MTPLVERGELTGTVLTFVDVSARQEAELAERAGRDVAEAANRAKSGLIASMSEEVDVAVARLTEELERLEAAVAGVATDAIIAELESLRESERHLRGLVESMQHVAGLDATS